ncbi:GPR1/FUN34/YaaH family transporter [Actinomycetospora sp. NBRC 106378]|uniref:GPR1/FUN34/YaaH family transporter n=1 Tax=Actinomycetospora sp. NBRC 106378 TaxID=3032208 RepID=UPI002556C490|nr:GPR1/FUN34/YaaH family transporter [Actinomycetospora sp. NBRC 106378]
MSTTDAPPEPESESSADGTGRHEAGPRHGRPGERADEGDVEALQRTSIVLRAYASPLPLGLFAFAIGNVLLAVTHLGGFSPQDTRVVMVMLATFIALPQFLAAVLGFLTREPLVATLLGLLAVTWPTDVVVQEYTGATTSAPRGVLFCALAGVLVLMAIPGLTAKPMFSVVLLSAAARFVAGGLYDLTASTVWERVSGIVAVVVAAAAAYLAIALVIEDVKHRTVLPVGRVGGTESRSAMEAGLAAQARNLPQEAGVRAQL